MMCRIIIIALAAIIALHGAPVTAQGLSCGNHVSMMIQLNRNYDEFRLIALADPKANFEIWISNEPPYTWTILVVYPNGMACVKAVGKNWETGPPVMLEEQEADPPAVSGNPV